MSEITREKLVELKREEVRLRAIADRCQKGAFLAENEAREAASRFYEALKVFTESVSEEAGEADPFREPVASR